MRFSARFVLTRTRFKTALPGQEWALPQMSLWGRRCDRGPILFLLLLLTALPAKADEKADQFVARVREIMDSVIEHHIDPPAKQQMLLFGAKSVHEKAGESPAAGLSGQISKLTTEQQVTDFLSSVHAEFSEVDSVEDVFLKGVFKSLPGGGFLLPAKEAKVQGQLAANRYVGVGIALKMSESGPIVDRVIYDGPAWHAGLKDNDAIQEIDGVSTESKVMGPILDELRGDEGSVVNLLVKQPNQKPREVKITRGVTFLASVVGAEETSRGQWKYLLDEAPDIALINILRIGPSTIHELKKVESQLRDEPIKGVILNVRGGGGTLHDTVMLADQLLEEGTIGFVKDLHKTTKHESLPGSLFQGIPMAVTIAATSNGDRVYLAAALQDHKRAIIVGEPTAVDPFVRSHVDLASGDKLLMATGVLQRGNGTTLRARTGNNWHSMPNFVIEGSDVPPKTPHFVMPDYVVRLPMPNEERYTAKDDMDPLISKAIEVLQNAEANGGVGERDESVAG